MIDPSVEMIKRIERLERKDSDPESVLGTRTQEVGVLSPLLTEDDEVILTEDDRPIFGEIDA
jgi:hypothetical protein